ncbi:tRNA (adenosine(37)-N6)-threonylcarbamoyltransferase complex ATPase subunit type 1 TsaE [Jhaorihella thermophila]|uniref:tRNA threonylcarbamoyladenosine biosynthesis protein TsaE n=1 Tax=Jhaorihella thermophila TaxID=488547 RepID=A0A1H5VT32_9RHOB|nr:tRNA (adenosine(37)-N6)-threonylcarbamoyltransferase complex ATPase subunit type 1 TsaE [Jhaorihella thermophila]SEF89697.1 tRNA threonylcarbamoyladenosine biosynthesis protein TsaE [Jhaorihella thermophila]
MTATAEISARTPEDTARLAERLGRRLRPGDVLLLEGPIGAGKTHFARCLIQSLMDTPEDVPSPTFTLVQTYDTAAGEIWHADLYRLTSLDEIEELGLAEAFESAICLIEWPDRLGPLSPPGALTVRFESDPDDELARRIAFGWTDPRWKAVVEKL